MSGTKTTTWSGQAAVGAMLASAPRHDVSDAPVDARPSVDSEGLAAAATFSQRADCTRRRIGAVVYDVHGRVIATGRNGAPRGAEGCLTAGACPRGQLTYEQLPPESPYAGRDVSTPCTALHAEENALLHSSFVERIGGTMYVSDRPCPNCLRLLSGSRLARVVWPAGEITL